MRIGLIESFLWSLQRLCRYKSVLWSTFGWAAHIVGCPICLPMLARPWVLPEDWKQWREFDLD